MQLKGNGVAGSRNSLLWEAHATEAIASPVQPFSEIPMTTQQLSARASELRRQAASCPLFVATMLIERAEELERKARQGQSDGRN